MSGEYAAYLKERGVQEDNGSLSELGARGRQSCDGRASFMKYEDSMEAWASRKAMEFMGACCEEGRPFFAHVSLPKPHQCYAPSEPFWSLYEESRLTLPPNADYPMAEARKAPHLIRSAERWRRGDWTVFEPRTFEAGRLRKLHGYLGNVSHVDHAVGQLLAWLEEQGQADHTIVVYSSDHGDYACEHGIMEKAPGICADAITRIPMLWQWPGRFPAGHVAEEIVESVDVSATLCALAELEPLGTSDGRDLSHLLAGKGGAVHEVGVTEFAWSKSVRKGRWRYVHYPVEMFAEEYPDGFGELYDLDADPWEMKNLYFDPDCAATVAEMQRALTDWLITTTRPATILPHVSFAGPQAVTRYRNTTYPDGKVSPDQLRRASNKNYL